MPWTRRDGHDPAARFYHARQLFSLARRVDANNGILALIGKRKTMAGGNAECDLRITFCGSANGRFRDIKTHGNGTDTPRNVGKRRRVIAFATANIQNRTRAFA
ncbi:hypothetical protein D3C80_1668350 [compost metagenome]